ncbi:hypothetical protein LWI28_009539 [Acer negundo]|uniref:DUF4283 domain-containing protein n=1 Tax=Acer negundo TaxID=4023 RepID=A0AAD5NJ19_ACENE|nr:hypothetical protein LWI28_009539 [Acer negundo]
MTKVASHGWKKRRSAETNEYQKETFDRYKSEDSSEKGTKRIRSFAEVLKGEQGGPFNQGKRVNEERSYEAMAKNVSMSWASKHRDNEWLDRCAIRVLKAFSSVSSVNSRLGNRGFSFSSVFLGDKCVLWFFETETEREGFIRNIFFWKDCFVSMQTWSDSLFPQSRLAWVNCKRVPLSYWSPALFIKLGWMVDGGRTIDSS